VNRPCDQPHRPNPCSFTNPSSRWRRTFRCFCTLTLRALLPLREPSPRNPPTSDIPCRLRAPSIGTIRRELVARIRFHEHTRLTPPISRPTTHPTNACAPARSSDPVAFRRRYRRRPTRPEPLLRHPSEGMMQPRLGTPSTVSTHPELAPVVRNAVYSELNERHFAHRFVLAFAAGRVRRLSTEAFD